MGHDDRREIFERLEALERLARSRGDRGHREHEHGGSDRDPHHDDCCGHARDHGHRHEHGREDFQEKRIIDTIVQLVSERVEEIVETRQGSHEHHEHHDGDGEKRIVDLIVGLVSEHVREIVATELDRRFGRPALPGDVQPTAPAAARTPEPGQ